jgi:hypothetical protein
MVVQFECLAEFVGPLGKEELVTDAVDDHSVGMPQVVHRSEHHVAGRSHQRGVIDAHHDDHAKGSIEGFGPGLAFEQRLGPLHSPHSTDAIQVIIGQRLHFVEILGFPVHHPDVGVGDVHDLARGAPHDPGEDGALVDIRKVEKATAKIRPRYLALSPRSICTATKFIAKPPIP